MPWSMTKVLWAQSCVLFALNIPSALNGSSACGRNVGLGPALCLFQGQCNPRKIVLTGQTLVAWEEFLLGVLRKFPEPRSRRWPVNIKDALLFQMNRYFLCRLLYSNINKHIKKRVQTQGEPCPESATLFPLQTFPLTFDYFFLSLQLLKRLFMRSLTNTKASLSLLQEPHWCHTDFKPVPISDYLWKQLFNGSFYWVILLVSFEGLILVSWQ